MNRRFSVVLVGPTSSANIGAVCRAMANFGVEDLRLVSPQCNYDDEEASRLAVFAAPLLRRAVVFPDLTAALADCHYSVAATRRSGGCRNKLAPLSRVAADLFAQTAHVALVFGRERSGLTTEEVMSCSHAAAIDTSENGSLNLAQAVVVFLYEFSREMVAPSALESASLPTQGDYDRLFLSMEEVLEKIGYINRQKPEALMNRVRRIHQTVSNRDDLNMLQGIWTRLAESVNSWPGERRGK